MNAFVDRDLKEKKNLEHVDRQKTKTHTHRGQKRPSLARTLLAFPTIHIHRHRLQWLCHFVCLLSFFSEESQEQSNRNLNLWKKYMYVLVITTLIVRSVHISVLVACADMTFYGLLLESGSELNGYPVSYLIFSILTGSKMYSLVLLSVCVCVSFLLKKAMYDPILVKKRKLHWIK